MARLIDRPPRLGKITVTVASVHGGDERNAPSYVKALDSQGVQYFIFYNAIEHMRGLSIDDLDIGSQIDGIPIDHPKGRRLIEVEIREL